MPGGIRRNVNVNKDGQWSCFAQQAQNEAQDAWKEEVWIRAKLANITD